MPFKEFVAGTPALASDMNTYLMEQSVMVFATAAARNTALPTPNEGMVTYIEANDHLTIYNGTAWIVFDTKITTYTPTFTNFTLGNGTLSQSRYWKLGKIVYLHIDVTLGSTSAVTGQIIWSLPSTAHGSPHIGQGEYTVAGSAYLGTVRTATATTMAAWVTNTAGTYAVRTATSATIPATWAAGSRFSIWSTYEELA